VGSKGGKKSGEIVVESGKGGESGDVENHSSVSKQDKIFALVP
jgi:hypothetical protein